MLRKAGLPLIIFALLSPCIALAWADSSRYSEIVVRNPFRLKEPVPPSEAVVQPPPPVSSPRATVELTGITGPGILPTPRALLEIIPAPGKPMVKPVLKEGESIESVEVISIDVEKSNVVIRNGGIITNLTFRIARAAPVAQIGTPGLPAPLFNSPVAPQASGMGSSQPSDARVPSRAIRSSKYAGG
jgi:hypothetical protein